MRRRAVLGAVVLVSALAGCGDGPEPVVTATPTASASPSVEPSPTPTPMAFPTPAPEFSEPTPEGAIAAGTQFIALYDYAFSTGDAGPLMAMSAEGCATCVSIRDEVQQMVDGGYSTASEPMRVVDTDGAELREDEWFRAHLRVEQGDVVTVTPDGERHVASGGTVDFIFALSWLGDGWRVEAVDLVEATS